MANKRFKHKKEVLDKLKKMKKTSYNKKAANLLMTISDGKCICIKGSTLLQRYYNIYPIKIYNYTYGTTKKEGILVITPTTYFGFSKEGFEKYFRIISCRDQ